MPPFSSCDVTGEPRFGFANSEAGRKRQVRKGAINNFASHLSIRCKSTLAMKRAKVALARKLGVVLHRMWVDATDFRWSAGPMAA